MDDNTSLILTALAQGAAKAAIDVVPDAYKGLRELLHQRFAGQPAAEVVLQAHAADPVTYGAVLRQKLRETALADDPQVLALARELLMQLGAAPATPRIEIGRGSKGIIGQSVSGASIVGDIH